VEPPLSVKMLQLNLLQQRVEDAVVLIGLRKPLSNELSVHRRSGNAAYRSLEYLAAKSYLPMSGLREKKAKRRSSVADFVST
jgi:hypothetical protein